MNCVRLVPLLEAHGHSIAAGIGATDQRVVFSIHHNALRAAEEQVELIHDLEGVSHLFKRLKGLRRHARLHGNLRLRIAA